MTFNEFWDQYPRKVAKGAAFKAYERALEDASHDELMSALEKFKIAKADTEMQFIPHASTWLNQKRWLDDYDAEAAKPVTPEQRELRVGGSIFDEIGRDKKFMDYHAKVREFMEEHPNAFLPIMSMRQLTALPEPSKSDIRRFQNKYGVPWGEYCELYMEFQQENKGVV